MHIDNKFFTFFLEFCKKFLIQLNQINWRNILFNACINELIYHENKEASMKFLTEQTK
jgi:hypothetical protein